MVLFWRKRTYFVQKKNIYMNDSMITKFIYAFPAFLFTVYFSFMKEGMSQYYHLLSYLEHNIGFIIPSTGFIFIVIFKFVKLSVQCQINYYYYFLHSSCLIHILIVLFLSHAFSMYVCVLISNGLIWLQGNFIFALLIPIADHWPIKRYRKQLINFKLCIHRFKAQTINRWYFFVFAFALLSHSEWFSIVSLKRCWTLNKCFFAHRKRSNTNKSIQETLKL